MDLSRPERQMRDLLRICGSVLAYGTLSLVVPVIVWGEPEHAPMATTVLGLVGLAAAVVVVAAPRLACRLVRRGIW